MNYISITIMTIAAMSGCRQHDCQLFDDSIPSIAVQPNDVTDEGALAPWSEYRVAASYHFRDEEGALYDGPPVYYDGVTLQEQTSIQVIVGQTPPNPNIKALQIWRTISDGERLLLDMYVERLPVDGPASYFLVIGDDELKLRREL